MPAQPTMKDVAKACGGIHPSTVSLALRNNPAISPATRRKVKLAAKRLGYRPDPLLSAFNLRRVERQPHQDREVIAWIVDQPTGNLVNAAGDALWDASAATAEILHHRLERFVFGSSRLGPERMAAVMRARGIRAYIVASDQAALAPSLWSTFFGVRIGGNHHAFPRCIVASDFRNAARMAVRRLRTMGLTQIGLALDVCSHRACADACCSGYLVEQKESGARATPPIFDFAATDEIRGLIQWAQLYGIQALVTTEADYHRLALGKTLPIPIVLLDLRSSAEGVCGFMPDYARLGAEAVGLVVGMARANDNMATGGVSCTYVPSRWHGSLRKRLNAGQR